MGPEAAKTSSMLSRLTRLGFFEPARAEEMLAELVPRDPVAFVDLLASVADPDLALVALSRLAPRAPGLVEAIGDNAVLAHRLLTVLGASSGLGDFLIRNPEDWRLLIETDLAATRASARGLEHDFLRAVDAVAEAKDVHVSTMGLHDAMRALRIEYKRSLLLIATQDLAHGLIVDEAAADLADLAAAVLQAALAVARGQIGPDHRHARLAIIAMGKCGGRELNYVSDVDVVFVAEPAELSGLDEAGAVPDHLRVATRLAEAVISICSSTTSDGSIFTVDPNLRPEGRMGPLVRTLASHRAYYDRWARTWEFQALMKARPVAGDGLLGADYVSAIAPFVWTAAARDNFVDDVRAMRRRVVESLRGDESTRELKLAPGGLRDVEFAVQLLQLVHGRDDDTLRSPSTLLALRALSDGGYVGVQDAHALGEAYRFLRRAEHRVQLQRLLRTHMVPTRAADLRWLARSLGYTGDAVAGFEVDRRRYSLEVRRLHEKLFYRPLLDSVARLQTGEARLDPTQAAKRLTALGFRDTASALRNLEALTSGVSRRAAIQRTLLPVMLGWFAQGADPDAGLAAFRTCSDALGETAWYLRMLRDEGIAAERLAVVLSSSRFVSQMLARTPDAISMLGFVEQLQPRRRHEIAAEMSAVARRNDAEGAVRGVRAVRRHELVRIASGDLLGEIDTATVGRALTDVSIATLTAALEVATRKVGMELRGEIPTRFAVIGMGRLGGNELSYASDADVLFVHRPNPGAREEEATRAAHDIAEEMRRLLSLPAPDPALHIDAGLRPEGRQGPLVRSLDSYAEYYRRWSTPWEAQALVRAAPCAGDIELAHDFLALIDPIRWPLALADDAVREIRRLKARMETERLPRAADRTLHLKLGTGGLSDVEWTVQLLQMRHAARVPELKVPSTLEALEVLIGTGLLDARDGQVLKEAWVHASRLRDALTLISGKPSESLPGSVTSPELIALAHVVGASSASEVLETYRRNARRARAVVDRVFFS